METSKKIQDFLTNEDFTKVAITAYLLTGESFWSMLETVASDTDDGDYLYQMNDLLRAKISDNV
jgi:hypothetical protein